jgi:hypothetical protein
VYLLKTCLPKCLIKDNYFLALAKWVKFIVPITIGVEPASARLYRVSDLEFAILS